MIPITSCGNDAGGQPSARTTTGFLTPPRDLAQMAVYCGYLLENADRRQEMGKEGHALATDEFNLPVMVRKIESLYTKLIEKKN